MTYNDTTLLRELILTIDLINPLFNLESNLNEVASKLRNYSILKDSPICQTFSKLFSPAYLKCLLEFYGFKSDMLLSLNHQHVTKANAILKVIESLLKRIQLGKLSGKGLQREIEKNRNIYLEELKMLKDTSTDNQAENNFASLQVDFLKVLGIDLKMSIITSKKVLTIKDLNDVPFANLHVRLLDYLITLRNFSQCDLELDSNYFQKRFSNIQFLSTLSEENKFINSFLTSNSLNLKLTWKENPKIYSIINPYYNIRFSPFEGLQRRLLFKAFDSASLLSFLNGDRVFLENQPESSSGFFGPGIYFYDNVQKAVEQTLVYKTLLKNDLVQVEELLDEAKNGNQGKNVQTFLETNKMFKRCELGNNIPTLVPDLYQNLFLVVFEVATGREYLNKQFLCLKELPLGFHSVITPGRYKPGQTDLHAG